MQNPLPDTRTLEQLDAGMGHLLTLLVAPAGSGRSALLRRWVATRHWPVVWLALDAGDNDPACFVRRLVSASKALDAAAPMPPGEEALPPEDRLTDWINALTELGDDFALILDGYEQIQSPQVHGAVARILDYPPPHLHLFIASCTEPPLPLPRLRVRRQLLQVIGNPA